MKTKTSKITPDVIARVKEAPHGDLIVENGEISIPSVFMFKGGSEELFPFLYGCNIMNCIVYFENEEITVLPDKQKNSDRLENCATDIMLSFYAMIAKNPKIANQYIRYLGNIDKMVWPESVD